MRAPLIALIAIIATLLLVACNSDEERVADANEAAGREAGSGSGNEVGSINIFDVRTGDCLVADDGLDEQIESINVVPCDGDWEFAVLSSFLLDFPDSPYPGEAAIDEVALERCDFAGTTTLFPTSDSWGIGDRTVNCLIAREAYFAPNVGDCFTDFLATSRLDCTQPHTFEAFEVFTVDNAVFPGERVILQAADERCRVAFETYVGRSYDTSELFLTPIAPTGGTFDVLDDRTVSCYLHTELLDPLTGSMRDSGR